MTNVKDNTMYVHGSVLSVQPDETPRPASAITYTVNVRTGTVPLFTMTGVVPRGKRLPENINTIPASPGDEVIGIIENGVLKLWIQETFDTRDDCPD